MSQPPHDLRELTRLVRAFAEEREWDQFHTPKNLAMALAVEAAELMEPLQWLTSDEARLLKDDPEALAALADEIADVAIYVIRLADVLGLQLGDAVREKVRKNGEKYPAELVRGRSRLPAGGSS